MLSRVNRFLKKRKKTKQTLALRALDEICSTGYTFSNAVGAQIPLKFRGTKPLVLTELFVI